MGLLDSVKRGSTRGPQRIVLHGVEGIGKTTWASGAPSPIFLGTEDGFGDLDVARFPAPKTWEQVLAAVTALATEPHTYRTVVIDTLDHLERLVWEHVRTKHKAKSIEDVGGGFGKGYTFAGEEFGRLATALDRLREQRRMHVIGLAHSHVKTFSNPDGSNYDRFELRMQKNAAALWKEWPDILLFANLDVTIATTEWREEKKLLGKGKALGDGTRRVYTSKSPQYDAKNRYGLPEDLPLEWRAFANAMKFGELEARLAPAATAAQAAAASAPAPKPPAAVAPAWVGDRSKFIEGLTEAGVKVDEVAAWLAARELPELPTWAPKQLGRLLESLQPDAPKRAEYDAWLAAQAAAASAPTREMGDEP